MSSWTVPSNICEKPKTTTIQIHKHIVKSGFKQRNVQQTRYTIGFAAGGRIVQTERQ